MQKINCTDNQPYGKFVGGPVIGKRMCAYQGDDNQVVILLDHPGDDLFATMSALELTVQMGRAQESKYIQLCDRK